LISCNLRGDICAEFLREGVAMRKTISFRLNGKSVSLETESERTLLWVLRADLGLTGTKFGCGEAHCGACTVLVDKEAVRSCVFPVKEINGKEVLTIEGLSSGGNLHPLQKAFIKHDALQCGYCTPGMILNAYSLLLKNPRMTRAQIVEGMEGNLCRCGAHTRVVRAIEEAAQEMKGGDFK
jgi:aerobic-type carbon monoxide dehydrogenase small subunit (CoxS/CutS family)